MEYLRPIWNCLAAFCNCLHCTEDLANPGYEPSERTHLLSDPVDYSPALRRTNSDNFSNDYAQSLPKKDEQNALCHLVQNTALNMIDVGAMDSYTFDSHEYHSRIHMYKQRLLQQWNTVQHPRKRYTGMLQDIPNAEVHLTKLVLADDLTQMNQALRKVQMALADIKIEHKEAIIVPFRIP